MATYLVTGGCGFIGSNLVRALVERGEKVRVLDNLSTGRIENLAGLEANVQLIRGDITDAATVAEAVAGCDYVLHQAALPSVPRSIEAPLESDRINVHGTLVVLEAARKAKVKRVVYAASSSAYGETPTLPKVETMTPSPLSPYGVSKLAAEHYMSVYTYCYGLETVSLRYFNVFGPRQDPNSHYAAVIPRFVTAALSGRSPTIFGDGLQSRDFCFIDNAVEANLLACTAPGASGRVFNVACGVRTTLLEVIGTLSEVVGRKILAVHEAERAGDIKHSLADITLARQVLGYTAGVGIAEGLARTVEWYRQDVGKVA
ncbi:MAG: SDR family oxidoreductase [Deltaproteobacteria bacterium]|nr:SDR family oxidoreductase [Deltaproteobacteria bacterium]